MIYYTLSYIAGMWHLMLENKSIWQIGYCSAFVAEDRAKSYLSSFPGKWRLR